MIYALTNQKGGVGKTTLSIQIACQLALQTSKKGKRRRVLLIDADPQGSAQAWYAQRSEARADKDDVNLITVMSFANKGLHKAIGELSQGYDDVVIDGPPRSDALTSTVIMAADVVLVPVQPSPFDIWAANETLALIETAMGYKPQLKAALVLNRNMSQQRIAKDSLEVLRDLEGVRVLDAKIPERVIYKETAAMGSCVGEADPTGDATQAIEALIKEVQTKLVNDRA